jgi:hypothetical protein
MGLIVRESTAPIVDGETASGTEVEAEVNKIVTELNGKLENVNIRSDAAIAGSKLAVNSVPGAQMQADAITTAKMAAAAVPKAYVETSTTTEAFTTSATFVDIPDISGATLTPGSTSDIIMCDLTFTAAADGEAQSTYSFGFNINGQAAGDVVACGVWTNQWENGDFNTFHIAWAVTAPAASSMVIKPQYRLESGVGSDTSFSVTETSPAFTIDQSKNFRVLIVPTK